MESYYPPPYPPQPPLKHSGLGIASTVLGVVAIMLGAVVIIALMVVVGNRMEELRGGHMRNPPPEIIALGCSLYLSPLLALIGLVLGIIGLFQARKKVWSIVGVSINGVILVGLLCTVCMGVAMRQ